MSGVIRNVIAIATGVQCFVFNLALTFRHLVHSGTRIKAGRRANDSSLFRSPKRLQSDAEHTWTWVISIVRGGAFRDTLLVILLSTLFWLLWSVKRARRRRGAVLF